MSSRTLTVALLALAAATAWAQTGFPYVGAITGENVYVRSGPGSSYPCARLSRPAKVTVLGQSFGWLKIQPPKGGFSLIAKAFVQADGNVGTVKGRNVLVRAGSQIQPSRTEVVQTRLSAPAKVAILGETGVYYKIVPPKGVVLWISSQYVRRASGAAPTTGPTTRPSGPLTADPQPATRRAVVVDVSDEAVRKELDAFDAAEAALRDEFKKPRPEREVGALLERYEAIQLSANSPLGPSVLSRVKLLKRELALIDDLKAVRKLAEDVDAKQALLRVAVERTPMRATTRPARRYAAEGVLKPSDLFRGGATGPKRYTISDPGTGLITAYVQCTTGVVELDKHVGSQVGVVGTTKYDGNLRMHVVEAEHIVELKPAPGGARAPSVGPTSAPSPAPSPAPKSAPKSAPGGPAKPPAAKPAPKPAASKVRPKDTQPMPATGLPVAEAGARPAATVNEDEYK